MIETREYRPVLVVWVDETRFVRLSCDWDMVGYDTVVGVVEEFAEMENVDVVVESRVVEKYTNPENIPKDEVTDI